MADAELLTADEVAEMRLDASHVHPRDREVMAGTRWDKDRIVATLEALLPDLKRLHSEKKWNFKDDYEPWG